jgi:hypothetical protein
MDIGVKSSVEGHVERGVNEARMTAFALIFATAVGVGLTVGYATCVVLELLSGAGTAFGTALLLAAVYLVRAVRRIAMELMHRITGQ